MKAFKSSDWSTVQRSKIIIVGVSITPDAHTYANKGHGVGDVHVEQSKAVHNSRRGEQRSQSTTYEPDSDTVTICMLEYRHAPVPRWNVESTAVSCHL